MVEPIGMKKAIVSLGLIFFAFILFSSEALGVKDQNEATISIMTQNMDSGTDLGFVLALEGSPDSVDLTLAEIQASQIPARADLLAAQIAAEHPDMVALQEVTLWRVGPTPETATKILYDQLELLLSALASYGVGYDIVAVNTLTDVALPGNDRAVRYTDRDALLVRSDRRPPVLHISDTHTHIYDAGLDIQGLVVSQGWISADVHMGNKHFRLVATHLESPVPGVPEATAVQVAQAGELIHSLRNLPIPVVLCGDFNSDANFGSGPDATPSVALIETAGYADTWRIANPNDPGYTWPLFLEDQPPPPFFVPIAPFERIDLFFSQGIQVTSAKEVLAPAPTGTVPPYGSDHAGVMAT
ncbi:MAG: endonuclease/exonuclease/phosphatase family protein, partial [Acidobacteriota bacterium]